MLWALEKEKQPCSSCPLESKRASLASPLIYLLGQVSVFPLVLKVFNAEFALAIIIGPTECSFHEIPLLFLVISVMIPPQIEHALDLGTGKALSCIVAKALWLNAGANAMVVALERVRRYPCHMSSGVH